MIIIGFIVWFYISHLAAKTWKLVQLCSERLHLGHVHAAVHWKEEQQHIVLGEAVAGEDPLRDAILHDGKGRKNGAGERGKEKIGAGLRPPILVPL